MNQNIFKWIARIITLIAIAFMIMFSFDCFEGDSPLNDQLLCFLMHNIPAITLIIVLFIAWKYEVIGGVLFILLAIGMTIFFRSFAGNPYSLIVVGPFLLTGLLFIFSQLKANKPKQE